MPATTVTINCDVSLPNAVEFSSAIFRFNLSEPDYDAADNEVIPTTEVTATANASGVATIPLWPVDRGTRNTFYRVTLSASVMVGGLPKWQDYSLGSIRPPSTGGPHDLADLLAQSSGGIIVGSTVYATLADAVQAAVDAAAAGADPIAAIAARDAAVVAKNQAEASATAAALSATNASVTLSAAFAKPNGAVLVAAIGDSIAARNYYDNGAANPLFRNGQGWINWGRALSGGAFDNPPDYNFAVGGSTTVNVVSTQLSPLIAAIAANGIRFVCVSVGTNDANSGATIANIETRLLDIANQIVNAGATPIFLSPPPRIIASGAVANFDKRLGWVSSYITNRLPLAVPGVVTIGGWHGTFDPATNQPYGGVTPTANNHFVDGTHLSARGAQHAGKQLAAYMQTRNVGRPSTTMTGRSVYDVTDNPLGPIISPVFNATSAYSGGDANISGVVPTGWTVERSSGTGTMACSIGTPTVDGLPVNSFRMVVNGAGGIVGTLIAYSQIAPPAGLENKSLKCRMRVRITGASNLRYVELRNRVDNSVGPTSTSTFDMYRVIDGATTFNWPDGTYDLTLDATPVALPASLATVTVRTQLSISPAVGGSATVDILSTEWVPA